jgi:hypothetical protein
MEECQAQTAQRIWKESGKTAKEVEEFCYFWLTTSELISSLDDKNCFEIRVYIQTILWFKPLEKLVTNISYNTFVTEGEFRVRMSACCSFTSMALSRGSESAPLLRPHAS